MASDIEGIEARGPLTIDRIGREYSYQEGKAQAELEERYIRDSSFVRAQSAISVSEATYVPHISTLFETSQKTSWAFIEVPPTKGSLALFSSRCIPSLGNEEQREVKMEALRTELSHLESHLTTEGPSLSFIERRTLEEQIKNAHAILALDGEINTLDGIKTTIAARLNQYHKG